MVDSLEDVIKIEYYETFENDPLENVATKTELIHEDHLNTETRNKDKNHRSDAILLKSDAYPELEMQKTKALSTSNHDQDSCDLNFESEEILAAQAISKSGKFACTLCNSTYHYIKSFRRHLKNKHAKEAESMKTSVLKLKRKSKNKCHVCQKCFGTLILLKEHLVYSHSVAELKLNYRNESILQNAATTLCKKDIKSKTVQQHKCPFCEHSSSRKFCIKRHIKTKHAVEKSNYFCPLCSYTAAIKHYMDIHIASKHIDTHLVDTAKIFFCEVCGYRTPKKSHYETHIKIHSQSKSHSCTVCDYATNSQSALKKHIRTHTKEMPYVCDAKDCTYKCISKTALNMHKVKHEPEKYSLFCDKCLYRTVYKQSLRNHLLTHEKIV